jgi:predicted metal-dependent enzyme (double-stranded beta helix superfamily)
MVAVNFFADSQTTHLVLVSTVNHIARLRTFVQQMTGLVQSAGSDEPLILREGGALLHELVTHDDWLPEQFSAPDPQRYRQYLLHCDPYERFSVVSFVWGPGQKTPVHDHTVWGLVGVMRGRERCEEFAIDPARGVPVKTGEHLIDPGGIDKVSPTVGDIHVVCNALADRASVSIHVYGANIGAVRRHIFADGAVQPFVSGYANSVTPNLWDRSGAA